MIRSATPRSSDLALAQLRTPRVPHNYATHAACRGSEGRVFERHTLCLGNAIA